MLDYGITCEFCLCTYLSLTILNLYRLEENEKLVLTPFEKNLDIWRQLWRVVERSDLVRFWSFLPPMILMDKMFSWQLNS